MPADRERRLSRLTAKLLRRSSSSSAAAMPVPMPPTPTTIASLVSTSPSTTTTTSTTTNTACSPAAVAAAAQLDDPLRLHLHPSHSSARSPLSPSPASSLASPADDSSDLLSPLTARRSPSPAPAGGRRASKTPQHGQLSQRPEDEEGAEHVDQFPAVSFPYPAAVEADPDESSTRSSLSLAHAPDGKEELSAQHRQFEDYSLSRASSKGKGSLLHSSRHHHPRSSATSTPSLNAVDESRPASTPLSASNSFKVTPSKPLSRPTIAVRRQSLVPSSQQRLINTLLEPSPSAGGDYFSGSLPSIHRDMIHRKIWVKRPGSSPTLVAVTEDDLVDDLRDVILKKYGNSLGRTFDSPDIIIKLIPREPSSRQSSPEQVLGPEEPVGRTLDTFYPGGQTVDEALVIEVPQRRTPKPSPRQHNLTYCHPEDLRPGEGGEYFPPMAMIHTPNASGSASSASVPSSHHTAPVHSMSVITTGQLPPVPSPGSRGSWHQHQHQHPHRPKYGRQHTSSPTMVSTSPNANMTDATNPPINSIPAVPPPPSMSTPPAPSPEQPQKANTTPPPRTSSPRPKPRKLKKASNNNANLPTSLLDGTVPPINVLIVEDNIINLKLLEAFMKRLKVRWQTAMNGREAVNKWRTGGFHLVLMDIQLPVMSGLEATKEIRRYERLNNIGVFSRTVSGQSSSTTPTSPVGEGEDQLSRPLKPEDKLENPSLFKSPVIIVALTASSLQSDRNEALAAGCNDFLTKPVNIVWLEQKVTEWGCMQALIDFEGWRKWRGFADVPADPTSPTSENHNNNNNSSATNPNTNNNKHPEPIITQRRKSQPTIAGGSGKLGESLGARDGGSSPASAKFAALATGGGKESGNSSSTTIVPNGNGSSTNKGGSGSEATSPGSRSTTSHGSSTAAGKRSNNRNSGGGMPRTPRA
ncbi:ssk1 response regulator receiver [Onygenales sp. PD_40]|nr:ssk1 response regulator receiver [Onygenales sp. PD_40]